MSDVYRRKIFHRIKMYSDCQVCVEGFETPLHLEFHLYFLHSKDDVYCKAPDKKSEDITFCSKRRFESFVSDSEYTAETPLTSGIDQIINCQNKIESSHVIKNIDEAIRSYKLKEIPEMTLLPDHGGPTNFGILEIPQNTLKDGLKELQPDKLGHAREDTKSINCMPTNNINPPHRSMRASKSVISRQPFPQNEMEKSKICPKIKSIGKDDQKKESKRNKHCKESIGSLANFIEKIKENTAESLTSQNESKKGMRNDFYCKPRPKVLQALEKCGEDTHECPVCHKQFTHERYLIRHMKLHTSEKKFKCDACPEKFFTWQKLKKHLFYHTESAKLPAAPTRELECQTCNKKFANMFYLNRHMVVHGAEKKFKCEKCDKAFGTKQNLQRHKITHLEPSEKQAVERKYKCDICERPFGTSQNLQRHMSVHTSVKKYECEQCQKKFSNKFYLDRHIVIHTDKRKQICKLCGKEFIYNGRNLRRHMVKMHGAEKFKRTEDQKHLHPERNTSLTDLLKMPASHKMNTISVEQSLSGILAKQEKHQNNNPGLETAMDLNGLPRDIGLESYYDDLTSSESETSSNYIGNASEDPLLIIKTEFPDDCDDCSQPPINIHAITNNR